MDISGYVSLEGKPVMTEATEDYLSEEKDVRLQTANEGKMLYL